MSKVMLVEDDNNLREIYEARLQAEGYTIVTAHDGEEALTVAKNERPDLIISDVMMPKISGFEMLDILRNTEGLKDVKVIMLTALGQSDDQQRADRLGADSYLVKSQVTLEDIVKVAGRLLGNEEEAEVVAAAAAEVPVVAAVAAEVPVVAVAPIVVEPVAEPVSEPAVASAEPAVVPVAAQPATTDSVAITPVSEPIEEPTPAIAFGAPVPAPVTSEPVSQDPTTPLAAPSADAAFLQSLGATTEAVAIPAAQPLAEEAATVEAQIANFEKASSPALSEVEPTTSEPAAALAPEPVATPEPAAAPEQFITTAAPDLTTAVSPTTPSAQSAGNDDVLADALQSLTGQAPEVISVTALPPVVEAAPDANVSRGGNRVITPLDTPDKPDINTLLALEEAREISTAPGAGVAPTAAQPEAVAGATPPVAASPAQPFDPNNIAL